MNQTGAGQQQASILSILEEANKGLQSAYDIYYQIRGLLVVPEPAPTTKEGPKERIPTTVEEYAYNLRQEIAQLVSHLNQLRDKIGS